MSAKDNIWNWISVAVKSAIPSITQYTIDERLIWARLGNPIPESPYVVMHIISGDDMPSEARYKDKEYTLLEVDEKKIVESILFSDLTSMSIDVYGVDAMEHARYLKAALFENATIEAMQTSMIGFVGVNQTQDLSAVVDSSWEGRAMFVIQFYRASVKQNDIASIGHVPLLGHDADANVIVNVTIDEPEV